MTAIKSESLTVHDAAGQPYQLADAIFDVEAVRRLAAEHASLQASYRDMREKFDDAMLKFAVDLKALGRYNAALRAGIEEALMHLETNYDIDGQAMKDSDAAAALRRALLRNKP